MPPIASMPALGGKGEGLSKVFESGGKSFAATYRPQMGKNTPSRFTLSLANRPPFVFYVGKAGWASFLVEPRELKKVDVPDPEFGERFHVRADNPDQAVIYFGESKRREAVQTLFSLGWDRLEADAEGLKAVRQPFAPSAKRDLSFIPQSFRPLADLA